VGHHWQTGSCFTFVLMPLDHQHAGLVLHSESHKDGHINDLIRTVRDRLLKFPKANNFACHFAAIELDDDIDEHDEP
jgi:hypothetical protein